MKYLKYSSKSGTNDFRIDLCNKLDKSCNAKVLDRNVYNEREDDCIS